MKKKKLSKYQNMLRKLLFVRQNQLWVLVEKVEAPSNVEDADKFHREVFRQVLKLDPSCKFLGHEIKEDLAAEAWEQEDRFRKKLLFFREKKFFLNGWFLDDVEKCVAEDLFKCCRKGAEKV